VRSVLWDISNNFYLLQSKGEERRKGERNDDRMDNKSGWKGQLRYISNGINLVIQEVEKIG
jgi:hypothetical protein